MPGPPAPTPRAAAARPLTSDTLRIREVWADNLDEEMALINVVVEEFNYLAMDTEFPGVVRAAPATSRSCFRRAGAVYAPGRVLYGLPLALGLHLLVPRAAQAHPAGCASRGNLQDARGVPVPDAALQRRHVEAHSGTRMLLGLARCSSSHFEFSYP